MAQDFIFDYTQPQTSTAPLEGLTRSGQTLLVLGAGPKAIAIATKRAALAKLGIPVPHLAIVDHQGIAAHWSGRFGFTDGRQLLGTRPEKDVGFPYASICWGNDEVNKAVVKEMLRHSWQNYLVDEGKYSNWIDRGRTRPTHSEWSRYIQWVAARIELTIHTAEVRKITGTADNKRWQLACMPAGEDREFILEGDGLVLTGPGTPLTIPGQPQNHPRVMDGGSFWSHVEEFAHLRITRTKPLNIGVIGTGETAAAIVVALVDTLREMSFIEVISPNGLLYSRDEGFDENRMFSDPDGRLANAQGEHRHESSWLNLSEEDRREFVRRTDRGVFSLQAMKEINLAENVRSVVGSARSMEISDTEVFVDVEYANNTQRDKYDYIIVARGFNALWFTALLDAHTYKRLADVTESLDRRVIERAICEDLSIQSFKPRLHLPMLAGVSQGPGFPNLSCLGLLSDRILCSYRMTKE